MTIRKAPKVIFLVCVLLCAGCSSIFSSDTQPIIMQDANFTQIGQAEVDGQRAQCMHMADENVIQKNRYLTMLKSAFLGTLVGSATGAVSGAIFGEVGESVASGAAVGTLVGAIQGFIGARTRPAVYERFVEQCLHEKGFRVIGWESP